MGYEANSALWSWGFSHRGGGAQGPGIKTALGKLRLCRGICCPSSWQWVWNSSRVNIHFKWNNLPCWNHSGKTLGLLRYLWYNSAFLRCLKLWWTCASTLRQPQPCWGFVRTFSFRGSRVRKFRSLTGTEMPRSPQDRFVNIWQNDSTIGVLLWSLKKNKARQSNLDMISDFCVL